VTPHGRTFPCGEQDEGVTAEPFADVVAQIKADRGKRAIVPGLEPTHGNERAAYFLLLESPGPKAAQTGVVSLDNPDPSAANLKAQLGKAGIEREEIAMWNT
jgi:uracil-DNA glycosylase